jgi:hypothetical protein
MRTYLTKQVGDITVVYYMCRNLGECHIAYYDAVGNRYKFTK